MPPDLVNITEVKVDLDINLNSITIDEIITAIQKQRSSKGDMEKYNRQRP